MGRVKDIVLEHGGFLLQFPSHSPKTAEALRPFPNTMTQDLH